ncbi:MAG TPA: PAS fold family protein [Paenibacillaceae bacterium]|nr:PAS fold family protein [Paenibacillaceae bacterium]
MLTESLKKIKQKFLLLFLFIGIEGVAIILLGNVYIYNNSWAHELKYVLPFVLIQMGTMIVVYYLYSMWHLRKVFKWLYRGIDYLSLEEKRGIFLKVVRFPERFFRFSILFMMGLGIAFHLYQYVMFQYDTLREFIDMFFSFLYETSLSLILTMTIYAFMNRLFRPILIQLNHDELPEQVGFTYYRKVLLVMVSILFIVISKLVWLYWISVSEGVSITFGKTVIVILILVVMSLLFVRFTLLEPIENIKEVSKQLNRSAYDEDNGLHRRIPVTSLDEVGQLITAFNHIQSQIETNYRLKMLSKELESKNEFLQKMDKLKDDFLANTSHELRTPLHGIIGIAESLLDGAGGPITEDMKKNLGMIVLSGKRLAHLVNDILDFSKLKNRDIQLRITPVGIKEIVDVAISLYKPLLRNKGIKLINSIGLEFPSVNADEDRVHQIIHNLIGNAVKFTDSGTIEVSAKIVGSFLEIAVSDTGIGIGEDQQERIFDSFAQADSSIMRQYGGTGLGLSITKQLVELHGGTIRVESSLGKGSTFIFSLPLNLEGSPISEEPYPGLEKREMEYQDSKMVPGLTQFQGIGTRGQLEVLIVDDDQVNQQVLMNYLTIKNYSVMKADNGIDALALLNQGYRPDIILLDIMMPKMSGFEVCQKIRETFPPSELPVVFLSAKNLVQDIVEGFQTGANDYLTKPFSQNELFARIKTHIDLTKINVAYGRFVPKEFLHHLEKESIIDVQLGDQQLKNMTILFSDIRSFTSLSEKMSPGENFSFLNDYLGKMEPIINEHQGFIDKYIGDAVMALFDQEADDAVRAAISMVHALENYNNERWIQGKLPIHIGIGLNTGPVILGTIGGPNRMEGTVISDAVNISSRIEQLNKLYKTSILISEHTYSSLINPSQFLIRPIDRVKIKGKSENVLVYEVFDADGLEVRNGKRASLEIYTMAWGLFEEGNYEEAEHLFKECLNHYPQDSVVLIYLERCQKDTVTHT